MCTTACNIDDFYINPPTGKPELLELIQRKIYVSKSTIPISDSSHTDGETDISSDKASVTEKDHDIDMDGIDELHGFEMDFDQFDEIEASVEHGYVVAYDNVWAISIIFLDNYS